MGRPAGWRAFRVFVVRLGFRIKWTAEAVLGGCFLHASLKILAGHHGRDENGRA